MDVPFLGGSNDTIVGRVRPQQPKILLSSHSSVLFLATWFAVLQKEQNSVVNSLLLVTPTLATTCLPGVVGTGPKNQKA
jgi:hypothetical protein